MIHEIHHFRQMGFRAAPCAGDQDDEPVFVVGAAQIAVQKIVARGKPDLPKGILSGIHIRYVQLQGFRDGVDAPEKCTEDHR